MARRRPVIIEDDADEVVEEGQVEQPDPSKHILVDLKAGGSYHKRDQPEGWDHDRRLNIDGLNVEHVEDDENGVWCYRHMPG